MLTVSFQKNNELFNGSQIRPFNLKSYCNGVFFCKKGNDSDFLSAFPGVFVHSRASSIISADWPSFGLPISRSCKVHIYTPVSILMYRYTSILVISIFGNSVFEDHTSKLVKFASIFGNFKILLLIKLLRDKKTSVKKQVTLDSFFQKSQIVSNKHVFSQFSPYHLV